MVCDKVVCQRCCENQPRAPPGGSVYCTFPRKARLPHERQPRARRRPRAQQLPQRALCTWPATRTPAAGQAATMRAAVPPAGPVHCACHTKARRGSAGDHARSSSSRRLCVMRLPHSVYCACHTTAWCD